MGLLDNCYICALHVVYDCFTSFQIDLCFSYNSTIYLIVCLLHFEYSDINTKFVAEYLIHAKKLDTILFFETYMVF